MPASEVPLRIGFPQKGFVEPVDKGEEACGQDVVGLENGRVGANEGRAKGAFKERERYLRKDDWEKGASMRIAVK